MLVLLRLLQRFAVVAPEVATTEVCELAKASIVKSIEPIVEAFDLLLVRHFVLHLAVSPEPQPVR